MKWEILKGSEKDFEGAPGWSMVVLYNNIACGKVFAEGLKIGKKRTSLIGCGDSVIVAEHEWDVIAERRPITEPVVNQQVTTEWDGQYPIPSGTRVEVHFQGDDSRIWTEFLIEYMRDDVVVLYDFRNLGVESYRNEYLSFRHVKSNDDVARDRSIHAMASSHKPCGHATTGICADIYDAIAAGKIPGVKLE
ncbi:hypothetical protein A8A01_03375 [Ewingella americana]|nr:hypothetical protein A8A01_03375 [Ewingella americana]